LAVISPQDAAVVAWTFRILGQIWKAVIPTPGLMRLPGYSGSERRPSKTGKSTLTEFSAVWAYTPKCRGKGDVYCSVCANAGAVRAPQPDGATYSGGAACGRLRP
jgi:hypothetical protein